MNVCEAVIRLLRSSYEPAAFDEARADFDVFVSQDFRDHRIEEGVSLFLYRIKADGTHRTPPGRQRPDGTVAPTKLPLDLHFLLTAWAPKASSQQRLAGWMMRVMEDNPSLGASFLNAPHADVFHAHETVDVMLGDLSVDDMFHIWEVMLHERYELSVPYVARIVQLESPLYFAQAGPVVERKADFGVPSFSGVVPPQQ
ncbi:MAG: DUF4255 domain-containing protein [Polyangiaceae bacterium]|nr:DUF4255 domain-containing protein [Polyangiaceae bacterium]